LFVNRKRIKQWILLHLIPAALWLIWAIPAFTAKAGAKDSIGSAWFFNFNHSLSSVFAPFKLFFFGPNSSIYILLLITVFIIFLLKYFIAQIKSDSYGVYFAALFLIYSVPITGISLMNLWNIRFSIVALPVFIIIVAYLVTLNIKNQVLAVVLAIVIPASGIAYLFSAFPVFHWDRMNSYLTANYRPENKQIFIANNFIEKILTDRYYKAPIEVGFFIPTTTDFNWDKSIITENYLTYTHGKTEMESWYVRSNMDQYDEIFLLYCEDFGVELPDTFSAHGWKLVSKDLASPARDERVILHYIR
jgi:hypothetical protein